MTHRASIAAIAAFMFMPATGAALIGAHAPVDTPRHLAAVGELRSAQGGSCSATMIAPGWAVTAAHCLRDAAPRWMRPLGGAARYLASDVHVAPNGDDLAVVGVPDLGASHIAPDLATCGATDVQIISVAHGADRARTQQPARAHGTIGPCDAADNLTRNWVFTAGLDVCPGDSGGPVLSATPAGQRVLGIITHRSVTHNGALCAPAPTSRPIGLVQRLAPHAPWIQSVTATPPRAPAPATVTLHPTWRLPAVDSAWEDWQVSVTRTGLNRPYATGMVRTDGILVVDPPLHGGTWQVTLHDPAGGSVIHTTPLVLGGAPLSLNSITRRGARLTFRARGSAPRRGVIRARGVRPLRITVRPGTTRVALPARLARRAVIRVRIPGVISTPIEQDALWYIGEPLRANDTITPRAPVIPTPEP